MLPVRRWVAAAVLSGASFTVVACNNTTTPSAGTIGDKPIAPIDIGGPLWVGVPMQAIEKSTPVGEPIVIPNAVVNNDVRVQIAAQVDGIVELIGTPILLGTPIDPKDEIIYHPRDLEKKQQYRRLRENDLIKNGQILARLDEQLVKLQIDQLTNMVKATEDAIVQAKEASMIQRKLLEQTLKVPGVSTSEVLNQQALAARYEENWLNSSKELAKTVGDLETAKAQLQRYWVRSKMNGRVVRIVKSPDEFAKAGETILEIQSTDRVRVEGKLDSGYASQLRKGMRVYVEPTRPVAPNSLANYHRQDVTSIAVTAHPGRPLIVSGGMDAAALVWDATNTKQSHRLPHPTGSGVRSVTATGPKAKGHFIATGGDDGKVRIWDVSNPDKLPKEPLAIFEETHSGGVNSLAFSPDGRYLASSSGRDVYVWNVTDKKKLYALPQEHRDAVTSVRFTPQATLVTVSRDKSIRTWTLGDKGATSATLIDHRGGTVDILGVSSDGSKVLFDKDATRLDVVSLADERSVGTIQSPGSGARFATLAIFSTDDSLILTVGGDSDQKGELTVWEAPASGSRGAERRRLLTPRNVAVTCAAFSPDNDKRFIAVGTAEGGVFFWSQPSQDDRGKPIIGEIVSVSPADAKTVQVRVEMLNPIDKNGDSLQDRSSATIIIPPNGVPMNATPMNVTAPVPTPGILPAGGVVANPSGTGIRTAAGLEPTGLIPTVNAPALLPTGPVAQPLLAAPPKPVAPASNDSGIVIPPVAIPAVPPAAKK